MTLSSVVPLAGGVDPAVRAFLQNGPHPGAHLGVIVQEHPFLIAAVTEWASGALAAEGGAILVGTPAHLEAIRVTAKKEGTDLDAFERQGRAVLIDGDWLLAKFMVDGSPDGRTFRPLILARWWPRWVRSRMCAHGARWSRSSTCGTTPGPLSPWKACGNARLKHTASRCCARTTPATADLRPTPELLHQVSSTHASWLVQPIPGVPPTFG